MSEILIIEKDTVYYYNGVKLGECHPEVDGFYRFWPDLKGGYWDSYVLKAIAEHLDKLNAPIQKDIDDYFAGFIRKRNPSGDEE